jgi:trans-2,3-dihydro-3-hydroxyanthranilate isomerase
MSSPTRQTNAMTIKRRYAVLDVFTDKVLAGNPLAIVIDSQGLDTTRMQAIAREFNLSETVFVSPPQKADHQAAIRIFTSAYELPFAGHPTVGTAVYLALQAAPESARRLTLEAPAGLIVCDTKVESHRGEARFAIPALPKPVALDATLAQLAAALTLDTDDIDITTHQPCAFGAGNAGFAFISVRNLHVLAKARLAEQYWQATFGHLIGVYIYTRETGASDMQFRARMLDIVTREDPATGSAIAAFAGVLAKFEALSDGSHDFCIGQGFEMGRPSMIDLNMSVAGGAISQASISGKAIVVAEGHLRV